MIWKLLLVSFVLLSLVLVASRLWAAEDFEAAVFQGDHQTLPYRLLKPLDYDSQKKYPLVVFLHGAGERGTDNKAQLKHWVRIFATEENRQKYPCFVLAPQCPAGQQWVNVPWAADRHQQPEKPSEPMAQTMQLIAQLQKDFSIDSRRLYVAGLSMGGFGTWDAISRYPDRFAAAIPICGGGDENKAASIAKLPIWVFHGGRDGVVKTLRSRNMVDALKKAGGSPKYTEYPKEGHGSWGPSAKEPQLLPWLFAQQRP